MDGGRWREGRREGRYDERVEGWTKRVTSSKVLTKSICYTHFITEVKLEEKRE